MSVNVNPKDVDVIVLLDCSGSMSWGSSKNNDGMTRWKKGEEVITAIAEEVAQFDDDGITVGVFNSSHTIHDGVTPDTVEKIFRTHSPNYGTTLAPPLTELVNKFLPAQKKKGLFARGYEKVSPAKPVCFLIFTDGCPSDKQAVANAITDSTKRADQGNVGYLFIQVGYDREAEEFLTWLDEGLSGADYDCVARTRVEEVEKLSAEEMILKAFNG